MHSRKIFVAIAGCMVLMATALPANAFSPFKVSSIKVEGLKQVSRDAVNQYLTVHTGETIGPQDTSNMLEELYDSGLFETVELMKDGSTVIVIVKERPVISEISIQGIKNKREVNEMLRDSQVIKGYMYEN